MYAHHRFCIRILPNDFEASSTEMFVSSVFVEV
jgi:hypothetical protein